MQDHASASDTGRARDRNEDAVLDAPPLFAVADGVGGGPSGGRAARLAIDVVAGADPERLAEAVRAAHATVAARAASDPEASGMATTMTAAAVSAEGVTVAHVGDSRGYRLRDGALEQLTDDHAFAAELVRSGTLDEDAAAHHPQRSLITRSLGGEDEPEVDVLHEEARPDDVYLLCSDGLPEMLAPGEIASVLASAGSLAAAARALVRRANVAGGTDNISLVAFRL